MKLKKGGTCLSRDGSSIGTIIAMRSGFVCVDWQSHKPGARPWRQWLPIEEVVPPAIDGPLPSELQSEPPLPLEGAGPSPMRSASKSK